MKNDKEKFKIEHTAKDNMKAAQYDAILVLGVSTKVELFKNRVDKVVRLYKRRAAPKIIFSGRSWGGLKKKPKITEAKLMAQYAVRQGMDKKDIFLEELSLNTAGNFYFTKKQILRPKKIKNLLVITQFSHFPKAKYLAKKILGSEYKISWLSDGTKSKLLGHTGLKEIRKFFHTVKTGDDRAVAKLLHIHPHYKHYRKI